MDFQERVLEEAKKIPRGKVTTYGEISRALKVSSPRAVGQALRRNKHPITIPCHRVVCSDGRVGGYAGEKESKKKVELLRREGIEIRKGKIDLEKFLWEP